MALGAVLVDKARTVRQTTTATRIEGTKQRGTSTSQWFKARYSPGQEGETRDTGRSRRQRPATLMIGRKDLNGQPIDLKAGDDVEITSVALGTLIMQVQGDPKPIRKKRSVIGWTAILVKVPR